MNKKMFPSRLLMGRLITIFVIVYMVLCHNYQNVHAKTMVSRSFYTMGTDLVFDLVCNDVDYCYQVIQKAHGEVLRLDKVFSNYRTDSELYRVVNSNHTYPVKISEDFFRLTAVSLFVNILSNGAFDITSGSLVDLWKNSSKNNIVPAASTITGLKTNCVGLKQLKVISVDMSLKFISACVDIDYGAIGKGFALDKISAILENAHVNNGIINFGGNVNAIGRNINGEKWNIKLRIPPSLENNVNIKDIYISDLSVSTSGGYERYYKINGKRYSHIIDPRTGYPVDNSKSVTVVSTDATIGDALSTAFSVMDIVEVKKLLDVLDNIGVLIISDNMKYENNYYKKLYIK